MAKEKFVCRPSRRFEGFGFQDYRAATQVPVEYVAKQRSVSQSTTSTTGNPASLARSKMSRAMFSAVGLQSISNTRSPRSRRTGKSGPSRQSSMLWSRFSSIQVLHPDDLVDRLLDLDSGAVRAAVKLVRQSLKKPPKSLDGYLADSKRQGLLRTVAMLKRFYLEKL